MSFNEWIAGHQIEPAEEYRFTYHEALKDILSKMKDLRRMGLEEALAVYA